MQTTTEHNKAMPDVANEKVASEKQKSLPLDWVGMSGIEIPVQVKDQQGQLYRTAAFAGSFVSLDNQEARGIHMSRLFKELQDEVSKNALDFSLLARVLEKFLQTHEGLSQHAKLEIDFPALIQRKALKSGHAGWRSYPIKLSAQQARGERPRFYLETVVTYSSTCPASAALARQLIQENFKDHFRGQELDFKQVYDFLGSTQGINATPHAQRSRARVKIEIQPAKFAGSDPAESLIDWIEEALQTPVQTVVKREDEQEFALRNGQNLMFCEDAARRVREALQAQASVIDFVAEFHHQESLHPHDAVSVMTAGRELKPWN